MRSVVLVKWTRIDVPSDVAPRNSYGMRCPTSMVSQGSKTEDAQEVSLAQPRKRTDDNGPVQERRFYTIELQYQWVLVRTFTFVVVGC